MMKKKETTSKSVYGPGKIEGVVEKHTLSMLVSNEPGILARVVGLISGRGYNIESLTVAETDHLNELSRITMIMSGTPAVMQQIKNQLDRLVPMHRVVDMTTEEDHVERELALVKVVGTGEKRIEALQTADIFRARVVDSTKESYVFEITGSSNKVNAFVDLMRGLGMIDVSRTGIAAMSRGAKAM